jgi:AcrR family transcriptional regulator
VVRSLAPGRKNATGRTGERGSRREAVLDAATRLFAERGFPGVSIQEIADAAETHKTTVLYHFGTKEALYATVLDEALERIAAVMADFLSGGFESDHLRERVAYLIDQIHAYYAEHPDHARLLERELLEVQAPGVYLDRFVDRIYQPAVAGLEQAAARGLIHPVDPALFIHDTHILLVGYFCHRPLLERLRPGDPFSIEALIARRNHLVEQIFSLLHVAEGS